MTDHHVQPAQTRLQKQIRNLLESNPDATSQDLVQELDFHLLNQDDQYNPNRSPYTLEANVRALFLKELTNWAFPKLERELTENPATSHALGFDEVPDQSTFNRASRNRLDEQLQFYIEHNAAWTRDYAQSIGHPLGTQSLQPETKDEASRSTENRLIREKLATVPKELVNLVADELEYLPSRARNTQYHRNTFLETECLMGLTRTAAEQGSEIYNDITDRDDGGPQGDTHLHYIKQLDEDDILRMAHNATGLMVNTAKKHLEFERPARAAIDITEVPYYGDERGELVHDVSGHSGTDYDYCYKFATLSIVGQNLKFTLAIQPVRNGFSHGSIVRDLLETARQHVSINTVYADRAFATAEVIQVLNREHVRYVIPVPKNNRTKREIDRMKHDVKVLREYGVYGGGTMGRTNERAETTLALVPSTRDDSKTVSFYTNYDVTDEIQLDREETKRVVNRYRQRWDIENAYKSMKTFLPWTTSNEYAVRLFHFAFSALLYNLWRLVDFLVQKSLDMLETREKPRVKAKRFVNAVKSQRLLV
ncbi:transposase [Halorussus sp. AFM4]|uniref:transposase n=1 Tax=Halorussus sp. AFM4 TaxID=3421651 RepID=UPI003EC02756